jgi:alpha-L-fucosidase 2
MDLGTSAAAALPTDRRIAGFSKTGDPALVALYYQFGRYLLLASSRPGCQPANLQGIWNQELWPSWSSKWTCNINVEALSKLPALNRRHTPHRGQKA